jgi:hypothetical protein
VVAGDDPVVETDGRVRDLEFVTAGPGEAFQVVTQVVTEQPRGAALKRRQARNGLGPATG